MNHSFLYQANTLVLAIILFILMILFVFLGTIAGKWKKIVYDQEDNRGNSAIVGALFGLFSFILAFSFGMSERRYDDRRSHIVEEANSTGSAILCTDLYPADERKMFRADLKNYLEARITYFEIKRDEAQIQEGEKHAQLLWDRAARLAKDPVLLAATQQMLPALAHMADRRNICNTSEKAVVPDSIVLMLFFICLIASFFAGYISVGKGKLNRLLAIGFCLITTLVIYITLDLDRPRRGLLQMDIPKQTIYELRGLLKSS